MNKLSFIILASIGVMFVSCQNHTVFSHYESTPIKGWERNDTLTFQTDTIPANGYYKEEVGVRITGEYPFMKLNLVVEQKVIPSGEIYTDTLECQLIDEAGYAQGKGINHYQYLFPITTLKLSKGEAVRVSIHHCMKREILPGICDIGLNVSRNR